MNLLSSIFTGKINEKFSKDEIEEAERLLELQTGASDEYQHLKTHI